jgi:NitT/TauT family transport system substrate-binding protein
MLRGEKPGQSVLLTDERQEIMLRLSGIVAVMVMFVLISDGSERAHAQAQAREVVFGELNPTAAEWPIYIAQSQGFFAAEGIKLTIVNGGSAPNVINQVSTGSVDIADDGTDSEIAAIGRGLPIVIIAPQFAVNPYSLLTVPSVKTWNELKGKSVMLGTKEDVTAISLAQLAAGHGLKMEDFNILVGGSTPARYAALLSGNVQGAMLLQPFDLLAQEKGMNVLGSAADVMKNWAFTCLVSNTSWLDKNGPLAVRFLRAVRRGIEYGYAHQDTAIKVLVESAHTDSEIARKSYELDFKKWRAWDPGFSLSAAALQNVGKYQIEFGVIKTMPPIEKLYDGKYAAQAVSAPRG